MIKKIFKGIRTAFLLSLPLWFYIWVLKKFKPERLTNYAGIIGTDPVSYIVYDGIVLVDLTDMKV